jgi:histidinol dehydrogenase
MKRFNFNDLAESDLQDLCRRPAIDFATVMPVVQQILSDVRHKGDVSVREYELKFGGKPFDTLQVTKAEIDAACQRIPDATKAAFKQAAKNIRQFHKAQIQPRSVVETMPGVACFGRMRGIEKVGLYIPGGSASLPSTVLMLAIPARLAGCKEIVLCTPSQNGRVPDIILYAANLCGVSRIFKIGGAQAIAAMAYGTESVPKVYKVFGPGNQFVTAAKMQVSIDPDGAAIDMPAGPSEVLVVADSSARADFVAADLLAQAEHGPDSQVAIVSPSSNKVNEVLDELQKQLQSLPRRRVAARALDNSFALHVPSLATALDFSNRYAPEHLILNTKNASELANHVVNAGSVFIGPYSCESAGDYASGTNHSLPTYGWARAYSGVSVASFQKQISFQRISESGARNIGPTVAILAREEGLDAHRRAMELRYK